MGAYLEFADPGKLQALLGIQNDDTWKAFIDEKGMHSLLNGRISQLLGPLKAPEKNEEMVINFISNLEIADLNRVGKITTCLALAPTIMNIVEGKVLTLISGFCENPEVIEMINKEPLPIFARMPQESPVTLDMLAKNQKYIMAFIVGILPDGYAERLILKFPKDSLPSPETLKDEPVNRQAFYYLVGLACQIVVKTMGEFDAKN